MDSTTHFAVSSWLNQLRRLRAEQRCRCPSFLRPHHIVALAWSLYRDRAIELTLPAQVTPYAARMRVWSAIDLPAPVGVVEHEPRGRFVPLVRLDDHDCVFDTATQLAEITRTYGADDLTFDAVRVSMAEIMENCFAHARIPGPLTGLACAQSWPQGGLAQIAIADGGIGIRASLMENAELGPLLAEGNSCEIATRFGVTSKPGQGHAGYGLALTRQLLEHAGGRLIVVSGTEWMQAFGRRCTTGELEQPWEGTLAVLEWRTDRPLRLKEVYDTWPQMTGFGDDDFDI